MTCKEILHFFGWKRRIIGTVCIDETPQAEESGNLHADVQQLRSDFENYRRAQEKRLSDLTAELDEEKKIRLNIQVELERLKKRVAD